MRNVVLLDTKIDKDEALALLDEYAEFQEETTGLKPIFWLERRDFSIVPTIPDNDGDLKPTWEYRQSLANEVHSRYGDYGTDDIIMWVHQDNFLFKGIWGSAWSYQHHKYNFLLCRWDKRNSVNTFNTLFHEGTHPYDTLIKKELGIDINPIIKQWILSGNTTDEDIEYVKENGFDWDRDYVHGNLPSVTYIGRTGYERNEANLKILKYIAPYVRSAYKKRSERHFEPLRAIQIDFIRILKNILGIA